jgi:hypothetical protein
MKSGNVQGALQIESGWGLLIVLIPLLSHLRRIDVHRMLETRNHLLAPELTLWVHGSNRGNLSRGERKSSKS